MSEVPDGALADAENAVLDRDSTVESRRGFKQYGDPVNGGAEVRRLIPYASSLLAHSDGEMFLDDGTGQWTAYSGAFVEIAGQRVRDAQANRNLYVTTAAGVKKLDSPAGSWRLAGVPRPLDGTATSTGGSGFQSTATNVAYRATVHYTDGNENEIVSAPSQRIICSNNSGGDRDASVTIYLPAGLSTEYTLRLYRSAESADLVTDPDDELQLVQELPLTSSHISAGLVTLTDSTPADLRGATLYTSPSQEGGIQEQNDPPPLAQDICEFKGYVFYANITSKHRLFATLLGTGSGALTYVDDASVATTNGSAIVTSITSTADLHVGMKVRATGIPAAARILTIDSGTQVTLTMNATATGTPAAQFQDVVTIAGNDYFAANATSAVAHEFATSVGGTPAENIELTALALVFTINQNPDNSTVYAYYTSGFEDVPGSFMIEERGIGGSQFAASSSAGDSFNAPLTDTRTSTNNALPYGVAFSKFQQPEAVPTKNKLNVGTSPIKRILALRDSIFVLSDQIYRIGGDAPFSSVPVDSSAHCRAPGTAIVFNNRAYSFSDQGVIAIGDTDPAVQSRAIEDDLQRISSDLFPDFDALAFCTPYESARRLLLFVPDQEADTTNTKVWLYNYFTSAWMKWPRAASAAVVNPANDKLYLADPTSGALLIERKSFSRLDYADEEYAVSIVSSADTTVTLSDTSDLAAGMLIRQDFRESIVVEVVDATAVTVEDDLEWEAGAATAYTPIEGFVEWVPQTGGNPALMKHWQEAHLILRDADFAELTMNFATDFDSVGGEVNLEPKDFGGAWGESPWGDVAWGVPIRGQQIIRTYIPLEQRRCHWLKVRVSFREVFGHFQLTGLALWFDAMSQRFR